MSSKSNADYLRTFVSAIMAGIAICIGSIAFLCIENKVAGACAFAVGLFIVVVNRYALFTGAIAYVPDKNGTKILEAIIILLGNAVGTFVSGASIRLTRISSIAERAQTVVNAKSGDTLLSIFILAILCNMLIFYSVNSYKKNPHDFGKYLGILLCIPVFIVCSYEHCVANMCYMAIAWDFSGKALAMLGMTILGNTVGGMGVFLLTKLANKDK